MSIFTIFGVHSSESIPGNTAISYDLDSELNFLSMASLDANDQSSNISATAVDAILDFNCSNFVNANSSDNKSTENEFGDSITVIEPYQYGSSVPIQKAPVSPLISKAHSQNRVTVDDSVNSYAWSLVKVQEKMDAWFLNMDALKESSVAPRFFLLLVDSIPEGPFSDEECADLASRFKDKKEKETWTEYILNLKSSLRADLQSKYKQIFNGLIEKRKNIPWNSNSVEHVNDVKKYILQSKPKDFFDMITIALNIKPAVKKSMTSSNSPSEPTLKSTEPTMTKESFLKLLLEVHSASLNRFIFIKAYYTQNVVDKQLWADNLYFPEEAAGQQAKFILDFIKIVIDDLKNGKWVESTSPKSSSDILQSSNNDSGKPRMKLETVYPSHVDDGIDKMIKGFGEAWCMHPKTFNLVDRKRFHDKTAALYTQLLISYNELLLLRQIYGLPSETRSKLEVGKLSDLTEVNIRGENERTGPERIIELLEQPINVEDWDHLFVNLPLSDLIGDRRQGLVKKMKKMMTSMQTTYLNHMRNAGILVSVKHEKHFLPRDFWDVWMGNDVKDGTEVEEDEDTMALKRVIFPRPNQLAPLSGKTAENLVKLMIAEFHKWRFGILTGDHSVDLITASSSTLAYLAFCKRLSIFKKLFKHIRDAANSLSELMSADNTSKKNPSESDKSIAQRYEDNEENDGRDDPANVKSIKRLIKYYVEPCLKYRVIQGNKKWLYISHFDGVLYGAPPVLKLMFDEQTFSRIDSLMKQFLINIYRFMKDIDKCKNDLALRILDKLDNEYEKRQFPVQDLLSWCNEIFMGIDKPAFPTSVLEKVRDQKAVLSFAADFQKVPATFQKSIPECKLIFLQNVRLLPQVRDQPLIDRLILSWVDSIIAIAYASAPILVPHSMEVMYEKGKPDHSSDTKSIPTTTTALTTTWSTTSTVTTTTTKTSSVSSPKMETVPKNNKRKISNSAYFELVGNQVIHLYKQNNPAKKALQFFYDRLYECSINYLEQIDDQETIFQYQRSSGLIADCGWEEKSEKDRKKKEMGL